MTNPALESKINDIHSWWEVPCIAHFCSLFRASFNLIDFDIEDLEEALLTDDASDSGNTLIQELIVRLLRGCNGNNSISTFNYQMFLRRLFRQKCREFNCSNPFDNDVDFQFLPMRTKVEILHMLCDFRLDADDVLDILKDLDSDSLRVHPLGYDANKSAYWYFYGTRLYREDYPQRKKEKEKKRGRKPKKGRNKEEESDEEEVELGSGIWQVVCFTESDWERLAVNTEDATDKNEQALHQIIEEDFLPEIPKLFQEKERLQRKRFLELHPRKSSRIENLKRRKEEEKQYLEKYKRALMNEDGTDSEADSEISAQKARNARYERWKNRNTFKDGSFCSEEENSDYDSLPESVKSYNTRTAGGSFICGRGRQTNNSLSSVTGEIVIHSSERSHSPEWFDPKQEYLHIGMSKVLNKLKDHEDSWPFLEPVDEGDAPNYYKVVKTPMSLQRMEDKLDNGKYKTLSEFKHDFHLILSNCKQYNGSKNEYTIMGEKLEKVFNASVNRFIHVNNSSEGEDVTENSDFPEVIGAHRKRKRKRRKRTSSKSTEDADKENEEKSIDAIYSFNSFDSETRNADDALSVESRIGEQKPVKRGKGRPPKNASSVDALEQTLRDINKWLDNTPKVTDPCSASNSPPLLSSPRNEIVLDVSSVVPSETATVPKSAARPQKQKDPSKKRSIKENHHKHLQLIKQRRRDIQRTIDRLQPGKSKGNLISTIGKAPTKSNVPDKPSGSKDVVTKIESTPHRPKPMLSLGSVLSSDIINLDTSRKKHTFSDNDSLLSDEEDVYSENEDVEADQNEMQAENLALDKSHSESAHDKITEERIEVNVSEAPIQTENNTAAESAKPTIVAVEKCDKPKPNLGAWFKAFGAPKAQQTPKRKTETIQFNESLATTLTLEDVKDDYTTMSEKSSHRPASDDDRYDVIELPPPTPGRFFLYEEDKDQKNASVSLPSPDLKPMKRQRRLSTGSSVSERSSFSQDPNDPMNSPHPSLDESVYQSPQPYHQSPVHSTALKVGFYQDAFPKSNSCSPRDPMSNISPQHPMFSPRDSVASPRDSICSPRDIVASPRGELVASPRDPGSLPMSSPRSTIASPRYAAVSPRDTYSESPRSMCAKSPVYTPTTMNSAEPIYKVYKPATPSTVQPEKPFSIYPVKKRISAELEQTNRQQSEHEEKARDQTFIPTNHEAERHYNPVSVPLPQHILPPSSSYNNDAPSIPISLSHHAVHSHHPGYMDSYSHDPMLMNPYFRKDLYVPSQGITPPVPSQGSLFIPQNGDNLPPAQSHYSPPRQSSPLVSSAYGRGNVPLDFTATNSSPLPLTSKPNENYSSQYHTKYSLSTESALNFSNKNPQHAFYPPLETDRKMENEYQRNKVDTPLQHYDSRPPENIYHPSVAHSYRSAPSPYVNQPTDYYNGGKPANYNAPNLRYSSFNAPADRPLSRNDKQYYQPPPPQGNPTSAIDSAYMGDGSIELLNTSRSTFSQPKLTASNTNPAVGHYETSYQPVPSQPTAIPAKATKKSRKKKTAALAEPPSSETPSQNSPVYPHHYLPVSQSSVPAPQDLKHNGIMSSSAFNFNPTAALKSDYQQYFDNLRNSRFFAEPTATGEKTSAPPAPAPPPPNSSFPFLQRGNPPSFSLTAQAFMNANTSPCPPSIYSSPYLQRAPEELLRPMMLPQGLMPAAHGGGYPPGYLNMHDPINRSPWL